MRERIGLRATEFVGTTIRRATRAAGEAVGVEQSPSRAPRLGKVLLPAAGAAVAAAGVASSRVRAQLASATSDARDSSNGSRSRSNRPKTGASKSAKRTAKGAPSKNRTAKASGNGRSTTNRTTRSGNGQLAEKSR